MGPLLFSIGIRDLVTSLQESLGEDHLVLVYLDDIFILSPSPDSHQKCLTFFGPDSPLRRNPSKCKHFPLDEVADGNLVRLLGTCLGSTVDRQAFLRSKMDEVVVSLPSLHKLPKQHALLILRQSAQQKL